MQGKDGLLIFEGKKSTYRLLFSVNAIGELEEIFKSDIFEVATDARISSLIKYVAIGYRYGEEKKCDFVEAGNVLQDILTNNNVVEVRNAVTHAIMEALGLNDKEVATVENGGK
jgi:hypothetical protein